MNPPAQRHSANMEILYQCSTPKHLDTFPFWLCSWGNSRSSNLLDTFQNPLLFYLHKYELQEWRRLSLQMLIYINKSQSQTIALKAWYLLLQRYWLRHQQKSGFASYFSVLKWIQVIIQKSQHANEIRRPFLIFTTRMRESLFQLKKKYLQTTY